MNNDREQLETLLRKQALFALSGDDVIKKASEMVRIAEFEPGDYICFQGDPRSPLVLVISGQLRKSTLSEDGREIPVRVINPGQSGGEPPVLDDSSTRWSIVATRKSTVALFSRSHARQVLNEPDESRALNHTLAIRLNGFAERHAMQGLPRADARISAVIESAIDDAEQDESPLIELQDQRLLRRWRKSVAKPSPEY
jgi:CRP/FNR family cyclic AMP-dependent transcriptional regulator